MEYLSDPAAIRLEPAFIEARKSAAGFIRNTPDELLEKDTSDGIDFVQQARASYVRFALVNSDQAERGEKEGLLNIRLEAPFSSELKRIVTPKEKLMKPYLADDAHIKPLGIDWSMDILEDLTPEQRVAVIRYAYSCRERMLRLMLSKEPERPDAPDIKSRLRALRSRCAKAISNATIEKITELSWPPEQPPTNRKVKMAWHAMANVVREFIMQTTTNVNTRQFVESSGSHALNVCIMTVDDHAENVCSEVVLKDDYRPLFFEEPAELDEGEHEEGEEEGESIGVFDEEHGDVAMREMLYDEETMFCVSMAFQQIKQSTEKVTGIADYQYRQVSIPPAKAVELIAKLPPGTRKIIADALVLQFKKDIIDDEKSGNEDEEWEAPAWGPSLDELAADTLQICTHLQELYKSMIEDDAVDDA